MFCLRSGVLVIELFFRVGGMDVEMTGIRFFAFCGEVVFVWSRGFEFRIWYVRA